MSDTGFVAVSLDEYRDSLKKQSRALAGANTRLRNERDKTRELVLRCLGLGMSELEASKLAGVTRQTVREWAGK